MGQVSGFLKFCLNQKLASQLILGFNSYKIYQRDLLLNLTGFSVSILEFLK